MVSIANILLIVLMIIRLWRDGFYYQSVIRKKPDGPDERDVPPTLTDREMWAITIKEKAEKLFSIATVSIDTLKNCIEQIGRFNRTFIFFWILTVMLHAVLATKHFLEAAHAKNNSQDQTSVLFLSFLAFGLTVSNILVLFRCFLLLDSPPPAEDSLHTVNKHRKTSGRPTTRSNIVGKLRRSFLFETYPIEDDEHGASKLKQSLGYSNLTALLFVGIAIFFFIAANTHNKPLDPDQKGFVTLLSGITGTVSGLAISLVVARLCSRWFKLSFLVTCSLLLYAAVQPLSVFIQFAKVDSMSIGMLTAALVFKIPFFVVIRTCMRKGPLLNYFVCLPLLRDRVNKIVENHFEIKLVPAGEGKYKLNILKNGKLQFTSIEEFSTKAACDDFIKEFTEDLKWLLKRLQERPGKPPATDKKRKTCFRIGEELGAFWLEWIEVIEKKGKTEKIITSESATETKKIVLLESVTLRSEEKVKELQREIIYMVPYCLYDR